MMKCTITGAIASSAFDDFDEPKLDPLSEEHRWELIHSYKRENAIEEGVLVLYPFTYEGREVKCYFSDQLYERFGKNREAMNRIASQGRMQLNEPQSADDNFRKVRVIVPDEILVVEYRDGLIFLEPQDA